MGIKWEKIDRTVNSEGTTITYRAASSPYLIVQSRKRHVPHANGVGTWDFTSYFVIRNGNELKQLYSLKDAKKWAEKYEEDYYGRD